MASKGINKVILVGNLGQAPVLNKTVDGRAIANVSIATSESWKDKQTGQQREKTEWHRIVMFGPLADIAGKYLTKGSKVYVEGQLQTRKWQDKRGIDRYTTEISANEMQMLDSKRSGEMVGVQPIKRNHLDSGYVQVQHQSTTAEQSPDFDDLDDIPF